MPPFLLEIVDEFNRLQLENYSLNLRAYTLRRFIEQFVLVVEEKFFTKKMKDFLSKSKNIQNSKMYYQFYNKLGYKIHDNPLPVMGEKAFQSYIAIVNTLIYVDLKMLPHDENSPKYKLYVEKMISYKEAVDKLHKDTIKEIENLNIDKITNKYNFRAGIIYFIDKNKSVVSSENILKDMLVKECIIPEKEISPIYITDAICLINNYVKKR